MSAVDVRMSGERLDDLICKRWIGRGELVCDCGNDSKYIVTAALTRAEKACPEVSFAVAPFSYSMGDGGLA